LKTTALLPLMALSAAKLMPGSAPPVAFEWFEYTGRDAVFCAPLAPGHFRNPIFAGFYPDPDICRVGDDYYIVNSSFAYFPGIPIFHSRDLVNWTLVGHVVDRPGQLDYDGLGVSRGIFAPALSHHAGLFYLVCTFVDAGGNFLMTAAKPEGPWSDPVWLGFDGIDPSIFFDDDGRAWLVNNGQPPDDMPSYDGQRAIWLQEFDIAGKRPVGPREIIVNGGANPADHPVWIEGPHLFKKDGWHYLICAEGGTSEGHSEVVFRSRSSPSGRLRPIGQTPLPARAMRTSSRRRPGNGGRCFSAAVPTRGTCTIPAGRRLCCPYHGSTAGRRSSPRGRPCRQARRRPAPKSWRPRPALP
jgi:alpha-N-arabinofuranosidase